MKTQLTAYENAQAKDDPLAGYRETLFGGDAARGERIFFDKPAVSCLRCHKIETQGGEVGPNLTGIAARQTRDYLLEAIVAPNRKIAEGFETAIITTTAGQVLTGVVKFQDDRRLQLITAEAVVHEIPLADIDDRQRGQSAMPEDVTKLLTKFELRDLVEYLASLKESK